ncbi:MAG: DUF4340 domain-containing protein [Bacteroidia bacterium]
MKNNKFTLLFSIMLLALAAYLIITQRKGTIREELSNFSVEDTGSVTKIFLADKFGNQVTVTKEAPGKWLVNEKFVARNDAINMLLFTLKNMEVRSPVAKAAYNTIMKHIAAKGIKTEIYQNNKLTKVIYVGSATEDQLGTFMYIENSSKPFVIHIPGFNGYLTTRFIVRYQDWKMHSVFNLNEQEINSVISESFEDSSSFIITKQSNQSFTLAGYPGNQPVPFADQNKIMSYLSQFQNINYESEAHGLNNFQIDSIKKSNPYRAITVTDNKNAKRKIVFYRMPITEKSKTMQSFSSNEIPFYDPDYMYGLIDDDTPIVNVQYYVFNKLFRQPADFVSQPVKQSAKQ